VILLFGMVTCGLASKLKTFKIIDEVNQKLPAEQQFAHIGWYPQSYSRLIRTYKRLYPSGRLVWQEAVLTCVQFGCLLAVAELAGFGLLGLAFGGGCAVLLWSVYFRRGAS
jgi:hypothetical protein